MSKFWTFVRRVFMTGMYVLGALIGILAYKAFTEPKRVPPVAPLSSPAPTYPIGPPLAPSPPKTIFLSDDVRKEFLQLFVYGEAGVVGSGCFNAQRKMPANDPLTNKQLVDYCTCVGSHMVNDVTRVEVEAKANLSKYTVRAVAAYSQNPLTP